MMMRKCYSVNSSIDENNESVSRSWIVFRHGIVAKVTFSHLQFMRRPDDTAFQLSH